MRQILDKTIRFFQRHYLVFSFLVFTILFLLTASYSISKQLVARYDNQQSIVTRDRFNDIISITPNNSGYYAVYQNNLPEDFIKKLIQKEDKYFNFHLGVNPVSTIRGFYQFIFRRNKVGSSTLTQQLVKNLLGHTQERTISNKILESILATSLELHTSKQDILKMYLNSVYLGNQIQGFSLASQAYFDSPLHLLNRDQQDQLIETLTSPSLNNPWINAKNKSFANTATSKTMFELNSLGLQCSDSCQLTIDEQLTREVRQIVNQELDILAKYDASNAAVVIIKLPENELLAIIGSPDPYLNDKSYQVNMATKPRAIGSTVKPFVYLQGFTKDLRPYSLVDDREYKYMIGTGFPLYPKNFDLEYRGEVTLAYALANSLNVPTLKVLEYVGLNDFYDFIQNSLGFQSEQAMETYQLGIALGTLEMDLLSLSQYFTLFPNDGILKPLIYHNNTREAFNGTMVDLKEDKQITEKPYVQLINKALSDRYLGIEEFGMKNNLNLPQANYAVKTGTSKDFRDSWTIGYTPDFLVGVWVGNSDFQEMDKLTGEAGAGSIWNEVMQLLLNSDYNQKSTFSDNYIKEYQEDLSLEYGLKGDNYQKNRYLLLDNDLILNPFAGDTFMLEDEVQIPLQANKIVDWYVNGNYFNTGQKVIFEPKNVGQYEIEAVVSDQEKESISISLTAVL